MVFEHEAEAVVDGQVQFLNLVSLGLGHLYAHIGEL